MTELFLAKVTCNDEYAEAMRFVFIPSEALDLAKKYSEAIYKMKEDGLNPYRVSEFYHGGYWTDNLPMIGRDLAERITLVGDVGNDLEFAMDEDLGTVNTVEDLIEWIDASNDIRIDCECIECDVKDFYLSCYGKHCGTAMESEAYVYGNGRDNTKPMTQWFDFEYDPA